MKALAHLTLLSLLFATSGAQSPTSGNASTLSVTTATATGPTATGPTATGPTATGPTATGPTAATALPITPTMASPTSPAPSSTVAPTESKSSTTAKTSPVAVTHTTSPVSGNAGSTVPTKAPTTVLTANGSTITPSTQNNSSETITSGAPGNITSSEISTPSPGPPVPSNPCQGAPCKDGSLCVSLNDTYFCLCSLGYYYNSSTCKKGQLFPGNIIVTVQETSGLENGNSLAYQELHIKITDFFKNIFNNSDYGQTVIDEVSISPSTRSEMRAGGNVTVEVLNIFTETTQENEGTVSASITNAINSMSYVAAYTPRALCDYYGCQKENEQDNCRNGLLCKCKEGMERPNPQVLMCVASAPKCPDTCTADHNKQCLVNKDSGNAECVCLPGYKKVDGDICQECAFGYSGVGCEDQFQLILTIVGSIGGALILCLVIALIVIASSKNKNKNTEEENLIENDFQNLRLQQTTTGFSNLGADGSIFPKIRANVSSQPQNPYAHQRSMPRPDY